MRGLLGVLVCSIVLPAFAWSACPHEEAGLARFLDQETWDTKKVPTDGENIVIEKPMLLDGVTARLKSVVIRDGGKLVFDPTANLTKITSDQITIDAMGEMHIGSSDCKFEGKAEILLTGIVDEDVPEDPEFGKKFLGVKADGVLEIHGKEKKSFTQLTKTLTPHDSLFEEEDGRRVGVVIYEFERDTGKLIDEFKSGSIKPLKRQLNRMRASSVIVIASRGGPSNDKPLQVFDRFDEFVDMVEELLLPEGSDAKLDDIRNKWTHPFDAFTVIIDRAPDKKTVTISSTMENIDEDKGTATTGEMMTDVNGFRYITKNTVSTVKGGQHSFDIRTVVAANHNLYDIELADDVSSWEAGDQLVIASTDFDFDQAEQVVIDAVDGNKVKVKGELLYTHYGEIYESVDMRAEVGLLTRNVLIHGEMGKECLDPQTKACEELGFDNYGGHTKAIQGFRSYNIEGAELTNMGQMTVLGSYPIHFHMCHDTDADGKQNPLIQSNSIHHCFSRCVTIHGSHGVHVKNNVAHDTYGHCYFLEDGGEKRTLFEGNLGLTTRIGYLTPSDSEPTTFWLTSPLVTMIGNHAAGSQGRKGIGIWYIFPDKPVGPSATVEPAFFKFREAKHTPISEFKDNVAHSNGRIGLGVFRRLREDHGILGCSTYDPKADPLDKHSEGVPAVFNGLTAYKNRDANAKMRASVSQLINFKLADSKIGVLFNRIQLSGYQMIKDSLIIGETPNVGKPAFTFVKEMGNKGKWKNVRKSLGRSLPRKLHDYISGIYLDSEGPVHVHNVEFKGFKTNEYRPACGFEFKDDFRFGMGPSSTVKGLKFDFNKTEALRVCHKNMVVGPDEDAMIFKDLDGSLTGTAGMNLISQDDYIQEGLNCQPHKGWNMTVCDGDFARFYMWPKPEEAQTTEITKLGETDVANVNKKRRVSYIVRPDVKVVLHFSANSPPKYKVRFMGVQKGKPVTVGFCLPKGAEEFELGQYLDFSMDDKWNDDSDIIPADSMEDLDKDTTGKNVFLDKEKRILFVKFIESKERDMENDFADCPGGNNVGSNCPWMAINFKRILENIDLADAKCY